MFALVHKALPDTRVEWRDVWLGALFAGILFSVGKAAIGLYLAHSGIASAYGAAGSLVVVLLWAYYSVQILLFGAELCRVHSLRPHERDRERALVPLGQSPVS